MRQQLGPAPAVPADTATKAYVDDLGTVDPTTATPTYLTKPRLPTANAMEAFAFDPASGDIYCSMSDSSSDLTIARLLPDGTMVDWQTLQGAGHGASLGLENDGGTVYLWGFWIDPGTEGAAGDFVYRWPFSGQAYSTTPLLYTDPIIQTMHNMDGGVLQTFNINQAADLITIFNVQTSQTPPYNYLLRKFSDFKAGVGDVLATVSLTQGSATYGAPQGHTCDADYLYAPMGGGRVGASGYMPPVLVRFDWATATPTVVDLSTLNLEGGATGSYVEVEGAALHYPKAGRPEVVVGIASHSITWWDDWLYAFRGKTDTAPWAARANAAAVDTLQRAPIFAAYQTTSQSIPVATWTPLTLDTVQADTQQGWSATTNLYTAPQAGWYQVVVALAVSGVAAPATGYYIAGVQVGGTVPHNLQVKRPADTEQQTVILTALVQLGVGDTVGFAAFQTTTSARSTLGSYSFASCMWVHP